MPVTLDAQGWGEHLMYLLTLHGTEQMAGSSMSVLVHGEPALISVGHPTGCRIAQSGSTSMSVLLDGADTCSAVMRVKRVRAWREKHAFTVTSSPGKRVPMVGKRNDMQDPTLTLSCATPVLIGRRSLSCQT